MADVMGVSRGFCAHIEDRLHIWTRKPSCRWQTRV